MKDRDKTKAELISELAALRERIAKLQGDNGIGQDLGPAGDGSEESTPRVGNIREVFWMANGDLSETIYVSPSYETLWGQSCESLYDNPRSWMDAIHPQDLEGVRAAVDLRLSVRHDMEYRIVRPDGSVCWIRDRRFPGGVLNNSGTISAGGSSTDSVMVVGADSTGGQTTNSGTISATGTDGAPSVFGLQTLGSPTINTGTISATGSGSDATVACALYSDFSDITNSGTITARASATGVSAEAYGISATGGPISNSGSITAHASGTVGVTAIAYGIETDDAIINSGSISATAAGGNFSQAIGIDTTGSGVTNTGTITAYASDPTMNTVYGIYSDGAVINAGNITATANGGVSDAVYGIRSGGDVTNSGTISATASATSAGITNSVAYGIYLSAATTVNNSGRIVVSAVGSAASAYGIYFDNGGTLTNTGAIRAADDNAYEVYVNGGTVNLQDRYNINLDGDPARGSISLNGAAAINLNGALISATVDPDTRFNTPYRIFDGGGTVNGSFAGTYARNPAVSLLYDDQGTPTAADDTVSLSYHPRSSAVVQGSDVSRRLVNLALDVVRQQQVTAFLFPLIQTTQLAQSGTTATDAPVSLLKRGPQDTIYATPYYADLKNSASTLGYNSRLAGIAAGYDRRIDGHQFGFHLGYGHAKIDFNGSDFPVSTKEDQDILTLGVQGMTRWGNRTLRGDVTGFYGWHDYTGATGTNFEGTESAQYNSYGTAESLLAGYIVQRGNNIFFPEIGLAHTWLHQDGFSTDATSGGWSTRYSSANNNLVQALASLRWLNSFSLGEIPCISSVAVGGRYRITNDDLAVQQTVPGSAPVAVVANQDRAAATALVSLIIKNGDNFSTEIAYNGEYSSDITMHGGWLKFRWAF